MKESKFQSELIRELRERFPGCYILKNDSSIIQGIPDLSIFYGNSWAMLECKQSAKSKHQPNQDYHIAALDKMSFAAFIFPENKQEVLDELEQSFKGRS